MEEQLLKWYEELESEDENLLGGQETDEEDGLEVSDHNSASEEEPFEENEVTESIPDDVPLTHFVQNYMGRDGSTRWNKDRPRQNVRTPNHNKVSERYKLGVRPKAKHARTPLEALSLFLSNDFLEKIVDYTNICIEKN
ncbi:hypothetical protein NQ314_005893 [Rhamnusium bicolor]|uniref:Uncharacterized protein n=1 Tax=Rhamnusium bicolor TaxID=1586634 RepID=A0AAV8WNS9_9CUCU|nr:hypothetical protein NQ314_020190 [Rhamnusium bicolor]KAJ8961641.1 hypothetical protein NQ314_005893 [Rhamnusium bicolor]